ncbi:MAG: hypothetical protein JXR94_19615 [Candidatus Hydrogenedentes bacterium]|nr:hypothetical protein [Candidatus Hydrogenedentota bacterium]
MAIIVGIWCFGSLLWLAWAFITRSTDVFGERKDDGPARAAQLREQAMALTIKNQHRTIQTLKAQMAEAGLEPTEVETVSRNDV